MESFSFDKITIILDGLICRKSHNRIWFGLGCVGGAFSSWRCHNLPWLQCTIISFESPMYLERDDRATEPGGRVAPGQCASHQWGLQSEHSPSQSGQVYSLCNIDTHCPSTLHSIAAATVNIQRRTLLYLKKKEVMKIPQILKSFDFGYMCGRDPLDQGLL